MKGRKPTYNTKQDMMIAQNPILTYIARQMAEGSNRDIKDLYTVAFMEMFSIDSKDIMKARNEITRGISSNYWAEKVKQLNKIRSDIKNEAIK